jgi:hypothetical protein
VNEAGEQVLSTLSRQHPPALFYTELAAKMRGTAELASAVSDLETEHAVMVTSFPVPDPHLEGIDLRIVALVPNGQDASAVEASTTLWTDWLRQFLANHRCQ